MCAGSLLFFGLGNVSKIPPLLSPPWGGSRLNFSSQLEPREPDRLNKSKVFKRKASAPKRGDGEVRGTREEGTCHKRQVPLPTPHCLSTTHVRRHGEPTSPSTSYKRVQSSTTSETCSKRGPTQGMGGWAMKNPRPEQHAWLGARAEAKGTHQQVRATQGFSNPL